MSGLPTFDEVYEEVDELVGRGKITIWNRTVDVPRDTLTVSDDIDYRTNLPSGSGFNYSTMPHAEWKDVPLVRGIRDELQSRYSTTFNYAAINVYRDGKDYISWHADKEALTAKQLVSTAVYSVTFGCTRAFKFRRTRSKEVVRTYELEDSTLLIMKPGCQERYEHHVPKRANATTRINITFRVQ